MKAKTAHILFAAALVGSLSSFGQTSVTSDPVGFVTINVNASSDRRISPPMETTAAFRGVVASVTGNQLTMQGTGLNMAAYAPNSTTDFYVRVAAGSQAGKWFTILAADATSVTVDPISATTLQAQGIAAGNGIGDIVIYPHFSFAKLFPNQAGITPSNNLFAPNGTLILYNDPTQTGTDLAPSKTYFYYDGVAGILPAGWYDAGNVFGGAVTDDPLSPESHFTVRNGGVAYAITFVGDVATTKKSFRIQRLAGAPNDNHVVQPFAVPVSPAELKLFESGAFRATTNIFAPDGDQLLAFDTGAGATGTDLAPSKTFVYYDGVAGIVPAGWYDVGNVFGGAVTNTKLFNPGDALVVRTAASPAQVVTWTADLPYAL